MKVVLYVIATFVITSVLVSAGIDDKDSWSERTEMQSEDLVSVDDVPLPNAPLVALATQASLLLT